MKKTLSLIAILLLIGFTRLAAQKYTAAEYWRMEHDSAYVSLTQKQANGVALSAEEQSKIAEHKTILANYFNNLSDDEKSLYYKYRARWNQQPPVTGQMNQQPAPEVYAGERSMYTQYLVSSGLFGLYYGIAIDAMLDLSEGGAAAIPLLTTGASILIPVLSLKDKNVKYNSLALANHGKFAGAFQGVALGLLLAGDNIDEGDLVLGLSVASSIALGRVGYSLGKNKPWTAGRVALYAHYGVVMPLEGVALVGMFESENPRLYGLASLAGGVGGYLMADGFARRNDYTRGDVTGISTLTVMNGLLGLSILGDVASNSDIHGASLLIPAIGTLGSSLIGQAVFKNTRLSIQQGRNIALGTTGGAVVGLGLVAIFTPETATPYYVTSYLTGMTTFSILTAMYRKNYQAGFREEERQRKWDINLTPQNIFLNRRIASYALANPGRRVTMLPAFSATLRF